jgi:hypothetical protein
VLFCFSGESRSRNKEKDNGQLQNLIHEEKSSRGKAELSQERLALLEAGGYPNQNFQNIWDQAKET